MQQDALVAFGNAQDVAHFGGLATLDVPQRDHRALAGGQLLHRALDRLDCFAPEQLLLRPWRRRRRPVPRPMGMIGRPEPGGIDGGLVVFRAQRRERDRAGLTDAAGPGAIGEDAEDPSAKRGAPFELRQTLEDAEPSLLHHFLGDGAAGHEREGDGQHRWMEPLDQAEEGLLVAGAERGKHALLFRNRARQSGLLHHGTPGAGTLASCGRTFHDVPWPFATAGRRTAGRGTNACAGGKRVLLLRCGARPGGRRAARARSRVARTLPQLRSRGALVLFALGRGAGRSGRPGEGNPRGNGRLPFEGGAIGLEVDALLFAPFVGSGSTYFVAGGGPILTLGNSDRYLNLGVLSYFVTSNGDGVIIPHAGFSVRASRGVRIDAEVWVPGAYGRDLGSSGLGKIGVVLWGVRLF